METTPDTLREAVITAHRDVYQAVRAMPWLTAVVVVLFAMYKILELASGSVIPESSLLGRHIVNIVYYALVTPFFIAVHRFIILGEVTHRYRLDWRDRRYQLFFGWAFVLYLLIEVPTLASILPVHWMTILLALSATIAGAVVFLRSIILFPAIAVDAPGATPRHTFDDTRGHCGSIIFAFVVPFIPSALMVPMIVPESGHPLLAAILLGLTKMFWITLAVVIASRLYLGLADRLKRADAPAEA
jgi:hypothetical protein